MKTVFFEVEPWEQKYIQEKLGHEVVCFDETLNENNIGVAKHAEILGVFIYSKMNRSLLSQLPKLRLIATCSTGYDHIDLVECKKRGIVVVCVPTYAENTVAEHTFALLLALTRKIVLAHDQIRRGDFTLSALRCIDLKGKTLGIVGMGHIGEHVAKIAQGFGMHILVHSPHPTTVYQYVSFEELLQKSDIVTFHCPLTTATKHVLNSKNLHQCKPGMFIINTSRGAVIETDALVEGLASGIIGGVGLDVLEEEDCFIHQEHQVHSSRFDSQCAKILQENHFLAQHPNVIITPHMAFNSEEALRRIFDTTISNIEAFQAGKIQNQVNIE
jgi:D-lactate dehydrogenase